jgi:DNA-binding XRE family transcriptional regulator
MVYTYQLLVLKYPALCSRVYRIIEHIKISLGMDINELVGKRITQLRNKTELSQQKFANEADIERSYLTHVEKGRKNISLKTLKKITGALGISLKEFFDTKDFSKP